MNTLECAANEAANALKHVDRSTTGLVISRIAEQFGIDASDLGRELSSRRRTKLSTTVWLDMGKVKDLGCGGDLGKIARYCDLGHDTLRIADGRNGKGVQRRTAEKIAQKFGKSVEELIHNENKQWRLPTETAPLKEEKPLVWDENGIKSYTINLTKEEERILRMVAAFNDLTPDGTAEGIVKGFLKALISDQTQPLCNMKL